MKNIKNIFKIVGKIAKFCKEPQNTRQKLEIYEKSQNYI